MQYAKCIKSNVQGSLAEKLFAQLISRHSPDFVLFFSFLYTDLFNVIVTLYFLQTEMLPAAQKKNLWILKRGPPQAPLLSVWIVTKKVLIPSIWKPFKNRHRFMFFLHVFTFLFVTCLLFCFNILCFYFCLFCLIDFVLFVYTFFFTSCLWLLYIYMYICFLALSLILFSILVV